MKRQIAALALLTAAFWSGTTASRAAAPVRAGWWNTATVSGTTLPSTTGPDDLHIALSPAGTLAFAAVSYHGPAYASAVLTLHVVPNSQAGTPAVLACPTRDDTWRPGGNQPSNAAPAYDCAGRSVVGVLGADPVGTPTLSFLLDPSQQLTPGVTSLALVPASGTAFSLDLTAPDGTSLAIEPPAAPMAAPPTTSAGTGSVPTPPATASEPALASGAFNPGSGPALPAIGQAPAVPQVAVTASPAPPLLAVAPAQVTPSLRQAAATSDRHAAAVLLVLVVAGLGYALVESRPAPPRLIGGRARAGTSAMPAEAPTGSIRGIGRFARPRTEPARRLL